MHKDAIISDDGTYRYWLTRARVMPPDDCFVVENSVNFVMLNPSTADASVDDPTIRRCIGFADDWGFEQLVVTNLFAYRATDPKQLIGLRDAIGPDNDNQLLITAASCKKIVCAWGVNGSLGGRDAAVLDLLDGFDLYHLGLTGGGNPKHPLYLPKHTQPMLWKKGK